jgi:GGDEF domain-containing protein
MDEIVARTRNVLRRSSDLVLARRDKGELLVILPRTARDGGAALANRLTQELSGNQADDALAVNLATAQYPEDGTSAEELYRIALERIGEIVTA